MFWLLACTGASQTDTSTTEEQSIPEGYEAVLIMPYEECSEPFEGDEEFATDGEICVNVFISGAAPFGTRFSDYGDCDSVRTNRPTGNYPIPNNSTEDDPRLEDPQYVEDLAWTKKQHESTACSCCHSSSITNDIGMYDIDSGVIWTDSLTDRGLAIMSGDLDSSILGHFEPEDNHGFVRENIGAPTTDFERWQSFFRQELEYRGVTAEDVENMFPLGGWLLDNQVDPGRDCITDFERVDQDGTLYWANSDVRYIYVMELGSDNPGLPPSYDLPESVIWRIDVNHTSAPLKSGQVKYGVVPEGAKQTFPTAGEPDSLEVGKEYRLWLLTDMGLPVHTHCRFTY